MSGSGDDRLISASLAAVGGGGAALPGGSAALLRKLGISVSSDLERTIADDQTNSSVVVGEQVIVKWLRVPDAVDRGSELVTHLAAVGFTATPALLARFLVDGETAATVHAYLPGAADGWTWCVADTLDQFATGAVVEWPAQLGRLAAELAVALATPSEFIPVPLSGGQTGADVVVETAAEVDRVGRLSNAEGLASLWSKISRGVTNDIGPLITARLHADLHVGQILRWSGGLSVVDFDGDPAHPDGTQRAQPFDRDLAHLLVSVELVASVVAKRRANEDGIANWLQQARAELLLVYQSELAGKGASQLHVAELLPVLEISQLTREFEYAAAFLPRFAYASADALRRRLALVQSRHRRAETNSATAPTM
jgi:maltokinase